MGSGRNTAPHYLERKLIMAKKVITEEVVMEATPIIEEVKIVQKDSTDLKNKIIDSLNGKRIFSTDDLKEVLEYL